MMGRMAQFLTLLCAFSVLVSSASAIGINYGQVASDLPAPAMVLALVKTTTINKIKLYNADPATLNAFAGSGIDFIIGAGNDQITPLASDPAIAVQWVNANIVAYPQTSIVAVCLGNEVLSYAPELNGLLLPALKNLHAALVAVNLGDKVKLSTPHSLAILAKSFPPSLGTFHIRHAEVINPMLSFLAETGSPFMINAYPYFAYGANPKNISLDYVLFQSTAISVKDKTANLTYSNMLDAQIDAIYAALGRSGYTNISVMVTETGWPSAGEPEEVGANIANAQMYNSGLIKHIDSGVGTPARPNVTVETYIFALYNENLKPGPLSERNFGLFLSNGAAVYSSGLNAVPNTTPPAAVVPAPPPPVLPIVPPGVPPPVTPTPGGAPPVPGTPIAPPTTPGTPVVASWCLAKATADPAALQVGIDYACSEGKANCGPIQAGQPCFDPNTLVNHASFAYNSYYQINNRNYWNCFFNDTGLIVTVDPSFGTCQFPLGA
ncbi:hypothetical protein Mapa_014817 [Marchantia paleacea]|nr:hypothetical protein Mapa_014817 [Marchantia paleacea]